MHLWKLRAYLRSRKIKDIPIGSQFNKWTVLEYAGERGNGKNTYWKCRCVCGTVKDVVGSHLRTNKNKQCRSCSGGINGRKGIYFKDKNKAHLYIIKADNYFKIGVSNDPERRIKDIQSDCPIRIEVLYVGLNEGNEEEMWHTIFKHRKLHGEWFSGSCELI